VKPSNIAIFVQVRQHILRLTVSDPPIEGHSKIWFGFNDREQTHQKKQLRISCELLSPLQCDQGEFHPVVSRWDWRQWKAQLYLPSVLNMRIWPRISVIYPTNCSLTLFQGQCTNCPLISRQYSAFFFHLAPGNHAGMNFIIGSKSTRNDPGFPISALAAATISVSKSSLLRLCPSHKSA